MEKRLQVQHYRKILNAMPSLDEATAEQEWLEKVADTLQKEGYHISERLLPQLWAIANDTFGHMGDIFWDADDFEKCQYCPHYEKGCPNSNDGYPIDPEKCDLPWYGYFPSERMLTKAAIPVFAGLIAANAVQTEVEYVKVLSVEDEQENAWAVLLNNEIVASDSVNGSDYDYTSCQEIARNLADTLSTPLKTVTIYSEDRDEHEVLLEYIDFKRGDRDS